MQREYAMQGGYAMQRQEGHAWGVFAARGVPHARGVHHARGLPYARGVCHANGGRPCTGVTLCKEIDHARNYMAQREETMQGRYVMQGDSLQNLAKSVSNNTPCKEHHIRQVQDQCCLDEQLHFVRFKSGSGRVAKSV